MYALLFTHAVLSAHNNLETSHHDVASSYTPSNRTSQHTNIYPPVFLLGMPLRSKAFIASVGGKKLGKTCWQRSCYKTALKIEYQIIFQTRGKTLKCTGYSLKQNWAGSQENRYSIKDLLWDLWKSLCLSMSIYSSSVNNYTLTELAYLMIIKF